MLVLGMAGWIDYWLQTGESLSQRAAVATRHRGGHLRDGQCEAIAVRASPGPLAVRATASPSPFDDEPTIALLEAGLGIAWPAGAAGDPVLLGDLPVDRGLMISVSEHTDYTRLDRATWGRPLGAAVIDVAGCQILGIRWDEGDHSVLHHGEREGGCVYPVTLEPDDAAGTVLRWTIMPDEPAASPEAGQPA